MPACEWEPTPEEKGRMRAQEVLGGNVTYRYPAIYVSYERGIREVLAELTLEQTERAELANVRKGAGLEPQNVSLIVTDLSNPTSRRKRLVLPE